MSPLPAILAIAILASASGAQQTPPPQTPCVIFTVGDHSGSKKGNFPPATPSTSIAPIPNLLLPNNTEYFGEVHYLHSRISPGFFSVPGMIRDGEATLDPDAPTPSEIQAFDGESFEMNAELPAGSAALEDFFGVEIATGQVHATLPSGLGYGKIAQHDTALKINIGSAIDRLGPLGRFAAFHNEDYLVVEVLVPMNEPCSGTGSFVFDFVGMLNAAPVIKRYRGGQVEIFQNGGPPTNTAPVAHPILGGFQSSNLQRCEATSPTGTSLPEPTYYNKPVIQWVGDAAIVNPPASFAGEPNLALASGCSRRRAPQRRDEPHCDTAS